MADSPNPYQAPLDDSFELSQDPQPADFVPSRLEFRGQLTGQHHRDAVTKAGIRKEYSSTTRGMFVLTGLFASGVALLVLAFGDLDAWKIVRGVTSLMVFTTGVVILCLNQRWLVGTQIPSYQFAIGTIQGWIDRDGLWIQSDGNKTYCPLSNLISSASSHEIWALCFGKDQTFWQTIPMEAFDDPALARCVASDLQRIRPPTLAQISDDRKRMVPNDAFRFSSVGETIEYQGDFHESAAAGTRLIRASKQIGRRTWLSIMIFFGCVVGSILVLVGFRSTFLGFAALWILLLFLSILFRIWRARRNAKDNEGVVAWRSKGWLDDEGYCAMTAVSQSQLSWEFFDHFEITDDVIGLYPHASDACCCMVSREQFASQSDWEKATEKVRRSMTDRRTHVA